MSGLVTMRESKASGTQRSGRAARQGPGVAYRCMSEADWASLPEHTPPEVATSDLTSAVVALAVWGGDESLLPDPLPAGPKRQAIDNLVALGAVEVTTDATDDAISDLHVTETGRAIAAIPASVWSARGLLDGADLLSPPRAAEAIAVIESDQRARALTSRLLRQLRRGKMLDSLRTADASPRAHANSRPVAVRPGKSPAIPARRSLPNLGLVGTVLSAADRAAAQRFGLRISAGSGTAASLPRDSSLQAPVVGYCRVGLSDRGRSSDPRSPSTSTLRNSPAPDCCTRKRPRSSTAARFVRFDAAARRNRALVHPDSGRPRARPPRHRRIGARAGSPRGSASVRGFRIAAGQTRSPPRGLRRTVAGGDVGAPVGHARSVVSGGARPDREGLRPCPRGSHICAAHSVALARAARLDELVPTHIDVPSGSSIRLDYLIRSRRAGHRVGADDESTAAPERAEIPGPVLAVKLQEASAGRMCAHLRRTGSVTMHLLSPAAAWQ